MCVVFCFAESFEAEINSKLRWHWRATSVEIGTGDKNY